MLLTIPSSRDPARCGYFWRALAREGHGPRGGRATFTSAACAACGTASAERRDARSGSTDASLLAAVRELSERPCPNPRLPGPRARLLLESAELLRAGLRGAAAGVPVAVPTPPLRFAVEHELGAPLGGGLDAAIAAAWRVCDDGWAMASWLYVAALARRYAAPRPFGPCSEPSPPRWIRTDGTELFAELPVAAGHARAILMGAPGPVSVALRRLYPAELLASELFAYASAWDRSPDELLPLSILSR